MTDPTIVAATIHRRNPTRSIADRPLLTERRRSLRAVALLMYVVPGGETAGVPLSATADTIGWPPNAIFWASARPTSTFGTPATAVQCLIVPTTTSSCPARRNLSPRP